VARVESNLNPNAKGKAGEIGVFQILPYDDDGEELWDTAMNIREGVKRLAVYKTSCADLGKYWFLCYNQGPTKRPKYPHLLPYVKKVMREINASS
jgi:hypothetical protein